MKSTQLKGKGNRPPVNTSATHKSDLRKVVEKGQDTHFSYNMTVLIGCPAEVTTRNGEKYEGIFVAYSSSQEIMLEAAHLIPSDNDDSAISTHYDVLIIPSDKLMAMKFENAMLNYATRDFQTDSAISSGRIPISVDRELTPWDDGDAEPTDDLVLGEVEGGRNGWAPGEMFKKNEEKYGVVSSYDQHLSGYTTSLDKSDSETFKKHEEKALQIAEEIEKNTTSTERSNVENGDDEEAKFSAVVRETKDTAVFNNESSNYSILNNNNNRVTSTTSEVSRTDKYVPPSRRNQNQNQSSPNAQPPPNTPPANTITPTSAQQAQNHHVQQTSGGGGGGGGNNRKPNYGGQRTFTSSTNSYYQQDTRRSSYERRGPPVQNQYGGPSSSHGDRDRDRDGGNRSARGNKAPTDRRGPPPNRDDPVKKDLMEFSNTFSLATGENVQNRRPPPLVNSGPSSMPSPVQPGSTNVQQRQNVPQTQNGSNTSGPSSSSNPRTNQKTEKEKGVTSSAAPAALGGPPKVDKIDKGPPVQSQRTQHQQQQHQPAASATAPEPPAVARKPSESPPQAVTDTPSDGKQSPGVTSPAPSDSRSNSSDTTKSIESPDSRKPFTFNVNAKEFNPTTKSFTPRSPATPPRPPSTPASTPQLIPVAQGHASYIMPPTAIYLASQYSQTISPVANTNLSASNLQQHTRHMNPHRKGMGVTQRSDLSPAIPVQAAGPLLAQGSLQTNGPNPYAAYSIPPQHAYAQQVRIHAPAPGILQMYNSEVGGDGNPIHLPLHYIHGGAAAGGHGHTQATVNVSGQNTILPGSPHGYTQNGGSHGPHQHHLYPFVGVPVVGVGYPHGPNPLLNQRNYYEQ